MFDDELAIDAGVELVSRWHRENFTSHALGVEANPFDCFDVGQGLRNCLHVLALALAFADSDLVTDFELV